MDFNFTAILVATFSSFIIGFVWYNPKVFGTIWMREAGLTEEQCQKGNLIKIFGFTFVSSFMVAFFMPALVIHQMGVMSLIGGPSAIASAAPSYNDFMADYGMAFRTFKHGALHGFISGLFFALPVITTNALFEQKSWKYIGVHAGYWILVLTVMGGIVCGWC